MKKIGNIVTTGKKNNFNELYNVVNDIKDIDRKLPTLIIGWNNAKELLKSPNILVKNYNNVSWTFSKTERMCEYKEDIDNFYQKTLTNVLSKIGYEYIDINRWSFSDIKKIINILKSRKKKFVFLTKDSNFAFVYIESYSVVFGISLSLCEYIGINKKKVLSLMKNVDYVTASCITPELKSVIKTKTYYIPIICSLLK